MTIEIGDIVFRVYQVAENHHKKGATMKRPGTLRAVFQMGLFLASLFGISESFAAAASELTRTHSGGGVTVKVTHLNPQGVDDVRFQVVLDTHSATLDGYDLKSLSLLRDETGKTYEVAKTENKGSGHHREITIIFSKPSPEAKRLELVIKDIAGIRERIFRWNVE